MRKLNSNELATVVGGQVNCALLAQQINQMIAAYTAIGCPYSSTSCYAYYYTIMDAIAYYNENCG